MPRFATIDVGSGSVLVHVAEQRPDGSFVTLAGHAVITRLGEGLAETGSLAPAAMERTIVALAELLDLARAHGVDRLAAVGTMALRQATNAPDFVARARRELGLALEVISGEEEARLSFLAARAALPQREAPTVVFDVGGGSTEFIQGRGEHIESRTSLPLGTIVLTRTFLRSDPLAPSELAAFDLHLAGALQLPPLDASGGVIALGGTLCSLAAHHHGLDSYDPDVVHGTVLDRATLATRMEVLSALPLAVRRTLPGIPPKRADTILAGIALAQAVLRALDAPALTVCDRGLRHGLMLDRFGGGVRGVRG